MDTPTPSRTKARSLPKLLIDSSMDYPGSTSSVCSLSYSTSTNDSSSMASHDSEDSIMVRAIYDFDGAGTEQLSFQRGEVLEVIYGDSSGWCAARTENGESVGWIPASYVEPVPQDTLADPEGHRDACLAEAMSTCRIHDSGKLSHYLGQPFVLAPDSLESPGRTGTRSKATPLGAQVILQPEPNAVQQSFSSAHSSSIMLDDVPVSARSSFMNDSESPAQEIVWNPNELLKLCPSSPAAPPPLPPTPHSATLGDASARAGAAGSGPSYAEETFPLTYDAYSTCHPRCAHRRLVRLSDGLYFKPLSVLLETASIYTQDEDSPLDREPDSPDENQSRTSLSRRVDKIRQITGDEVAQAVHSAKMAHALLPWYLRPVYGQELRFDHDGSVTAGTLRALVEVLVSEPFHVSIEQRFRHTFFSTLPTLGTPDQVFDLLLDQYRQEQPEGLTGAEADDWRIKKLYPAQRRIFTVFETWLMRYRMIVDDPSIAQRLQSWLSRLVETGDNVPLASELLKTLERLTFEIPSKPIVATKHAKRRKTRDSKHELLRVDASCLAENLCLNESRLYARIAPRECLEWTHTREGDSVANLLTFCTIHDKLGAWVKHSILWTDTLARRADVVDLWVKVAERCREMHNYSSMSAIVTALSSSVISRLYLTWAHAKRSTHLEALVKLNDPAGNFHAFRQIQRPRDGPCVPFIGPYLTDIVHINDQHRDVTVTTADGSSERLFNFVKRRKWADVLDTIFRHQDESYAFEEDASVMHQIETSLVLASAVDQPAFWAKSEEVQRTERASADLRKGLEAAGF